MQGETGRLIAMLEARLSRHEERFDRRLDNLEARLAATQEAIVRHSESHLADRIASRLQIGTISALVAGGTTLVIAVLRALI